MGEIANYQPNSDRAKAIQGGTAVNNSPSKIRAVDLEEQEDQKINWFREFILGSPKDAKVAVIRDVVFPSIKRMLLDAGQSFLTFLFDGGVRRVNSNNRDYSSISRGGNYRPSSFIREPAQTENVGSIFVEYGTDTKGPMELVRETLLDLLDRQGYVTVRDYYDALGKSSTNISYDNHYGWTNLSMTEVRYKIFDGRYYIANLPKPKLLDID